MKQDPRLQALGERVAMFRENQGLSTRELAKRAGVSPSTISRLENGHGLIALGGFLKLCDALGLQPSTALRP